MLFGGIIIILFEVIDWIKELQKGIFSTYQLWLVAYDYYKEEETSNNEKAFYHKFCCLFSRPPVAPFFSYLSRKKELLW